MSLLLTSVHKCYIMHINMQWQMQQHWTLAIDKCPRQQYNIGNYSVSGALASEVALMVTHEGCYVGVSREDKELRGKMGRGHERLISTYPQFSVWRGEDKPRSLTVNGRVVAFRHHYERAFWRRVFDLLTSLLKERIVFDRRQM